MHVIAPAGELQHNTLPYAVALLPLREAVAAQRSPQGLQLPEGARRLVVSIDGTESDEEIAGLQVGTTESKTMRLVHCAQVQVQVQAQASPAQ